MEKPKNSRIRYTLFTKYEKKYRKRIEKICPKCKGKMKEEIKYDFKGKVPYKKIEKKNGKVIYAVSRNRKGGGTGFVLTYEQIPDAYTRMIYYCCQSCAEEYTIGYLAEQYFTNAGVDVNKMDNTNIRWLVYGLAIIITLILGVSIGGLEQGYKPALIIIFCISLSEAFRNKKQQKIQK